MFNIIFMVVFGVIAIVTIFIIFRSFTMFSSKGRSRMMNKMMDDVIETSKDILDEHEADLKELSKRSAEIEAEAIKIKAKAVKDGLSKDN
ncbi:MAG: hypothetical protein VZS44_08525 [Bacilli bacterium]|nr:hypothetical protein [Bacilli bacterium]